MTGHGIRPAAPLIRTLGESAILIEMTGDSAPERASALAARLHAAPPDGVLDAVAAYESVAVYFDPVTRDPGALTNALRRAAADETTPGAASSASHVIPVVYDGQDLDSVAAHTGLTRTQVAEIHSSTEYSVLAVGFVPGFAYLGKLDERLRIPRKDTPRTRVPAGAVAIAGAHTAVYPLATPGGWHLIGSAAIRLFDPSRTPPALLVTGDRVRFRPE